MLPGKELPNIGGTLNSSELPLILSHGKGDALLLYKLKNLLDFKDTDQALMRPRCN